MSSIPSHVGTSYSKSQRLNRMGHPSVPLKQGTGGGGGGGGAGRGREGLIYGLHFVLASYC